jgi:catechol 2,3-dioxygenase-like lactoylglutathione lyase family enzyme
MQMTRILSYEHVGIRVTDRETAVRFYKMLGFDKVLDLPEHHANEMTNDAGVTINLIFNGVKREANRNILLDEPVKWPGMTHPAFVVDDLDALLTKLAHEGVKVTEGPHLIGERRRAFFVRDPDGNVLEFNELLAANRPIPAKATA